MSSRSSRARSSAARPRYRSVSISTGGGSGTGVRRRVSPETAPSCAILVLRSARSSAPRAGVAFDGSFLRGNPARTTCGPGSSKKNADIGESSSELVIASNVGANARGVHCLSDLPDRLDKPDEYGPAHDRVTDVELLDLGNCSHRTDIAHGEAVAGMDGETESRSVAGGLLQRSDRLRIIRPARIIAGVQLYRVCPELLRLRNHAGIGIDEKADPDTRLAKASHRGRYPRLFAYYVETTFRRDLLAPLGHEGHLRRTMPQRDADHFIDACSFEIEECRNRRCERLHIRVLYVSSVLSQVSGDAIRSRHLAHHRSFYGTRLRAAARLSQRCDMIYVHIEALMSCCHFSRPLGSHQLSWSTE